MSVRIVEYRHSLDDKNAVRVKFELERDQVLRFLVQLECRFNGKWVPVVRYDTAHDFAHRDLLHPSGESAKTRLNVRDFGEALTFALRDLNENWLNYRRRYEEWLEQK